MWPILQNHLLPNKVQRFILVAFPFKATFRRYIKRLREQMAKDTQYRWLKIIWMREANMFERRSTEMDEKTLESNDAI